MVPDVNKRLHQEEYPRTDMRSLWDVLGLCDIIVRLLAFWACLTKGPTPRRTRQSAHIRLLRPLACKGRASASRAGP